MVLEQEDSDKEPVMSLDYDAPQFGIGANDLSRLGKTKII